MDPIEMEDQILKIVKKKHNDTGGNNGNFFGDFDHILKMDISERNNFLQNMVTRKLIVIREGQNARMIMLPK
ncbi:hypothetical protein PGH12_05840 [Chryseobacterium wangxinyae]|uniref:hypothetical protein n=1 Tax=Chryseobacterium sp. CY350 TaxID=2997336 RepID=UPI00226DB4DC|nr:hypothetical protein [Chryseobacterium sp. CY350]MCY0976671.1 hypothetical protein [Chryseobacterium sp. CY350]WBZ96672.1 hypothetical protein PGH12_05840 [Chryseobacterium sp. CY350]